MEAQGCWGTSDSCLRRVSPRTHTVFFRWHGVPTEKLGLQVQPVLSLAVEGRGGDEEQMACPCHIALRTRAAVARRLPMATGSVSGRLGASASLIPAWYLPLKSPPGTPTAWPEFQEVSFLSPVINHTQRLLPSGLVGMDTEGV